ncbi:MAG: response regulator [Solirubrobacterales bacterium]
MAASVLIIDDDPVFRGLAERLLVAAGLNVASQADSVGAGMSAARELEPDAILLDVMLPDGSGVTPARAFAALPWRPRVLLTSSSPDAVAQEEIEASGVVAFVWKNELADAPLRRLLENP